MYQSFFSYAIKIYPSNHTKVVERKIQPREMVKSPCESVVLKLKIC